MDGAGEDTAEVAIKKGNELPLEATGPSAATDDDDDDDDDDDVIVVV